MTCDLFGLAFDVSDRNPVRGYFWLESGQRCGQSLAPGRYRVGDECSKREGVELVPVTQLFDKGRTYWVPTAFLAPKLLK
jgi:hypothetical protein